MPKPKSSLLKRHGLNMQAILPLAELPDDLRAELGKNCNLSAYTQLLVFGHGGATMWQAMQQTPFRNVENPIDAFSSHTVEQYFSQELPEHNYTILYPGQQQLIPLRKLGQLAGWHHATPFRIGIHPQFGSWFAYRVVALADTTLQPSPQLETVHPCDNCVDKPCITICPADALQQEDSGLQRCMDYRLTPDSRCALQCLARSCCPTGREHKYPQAQMSYCYGLSLQTISRL